MMFLHVETQRKENKTTETQREENDMDPAGLLMILGPNRLLPADLTTKSICASRGNRVIPSGAKISAF